MGKLRNKRYYEQVEQLSPAALPVTEYAARTGTNRSYIHVKYDRYRKGFTKEGKKYHGADPGYTIVTYHGHCYVIENQYK